MASASGVRSKGVVCSLAAVALFATAPTASAASGTASGPEGQRLTVSKTSGLAATGETVTVSGTGYNTEKGIYVAFCVDNGPGKTPTPCVGGVDMSGESGASVWVSSTPPSYGEGLAEPYGGSAHQGTFSVQLKVRAKDANTDCAAAGVTCAVITRNDHTRGGDQSQTVRVPVTFGGADSGATGGSSTSPSATASALATGGSSGSVTSSAPSGSMADTGSGLALPLGIASAGLLAAGGGAWVWARRRRELKSPG
ncbi:neocarzinostatin apoprotein domain-containing protein [Streptomyces acidiscabies]|uniref:Neocarzinostatin apoprotein domain-containing protein n=1 Tax=Streptomyces acidiscabies TaxID=42234 RepID=A0AAP6B783_9ACTN|nr:neocarzinostatin apoprotein domain-containing protein [Streptomyces acidiscabies]MBP5939711.1 hypothetical protein [Streptomyces sp. LBUM 1476]MBZ3910887.1 hypothetical protein [Streptomyces acidiscabies]MDX2959333.1 neocarzinostatin apoprotein domain-containing protein [Streptomyces acidiscabies]MDX3017523.1 neocarzinostatin apoprotein domain-containing protein [Streptomyces acidiscabies]MDX3787999.1 neocarzinostatin apoprotein domain-containing protein [Streptomyces acidiscabies]